MDKIKLAEEVAARTLIPNFDGMKWISKAKKHISPRTLTDAEACEMLKNGWLSPEMFKKLPDCYLNETEKTESNENIESRNTQKTGRKPKQKGTSR